MEDDLLEKQVEVKHFWAGLSDAGPDEGVMEKISLLISLGWWIDCVTSCDRGIFFVLVKHNHNEDEDEQD